MGKAVFGASMLALISMGMPGAARAQEGMGLAGIHDWIKVGRKTCMADHFHDGSGTGASKAQAQAAAIRAWADFTAWEYGNQWGRYSIALSKSVSCTGGRGSVSCSVSARPCRPY